MSDKELLILSLVEDLSDSIKSYFEESSINLVERSEVQDITELDYIIVTNQDEASSVAKEYSTLKNDIKIICYSNVDAVKNYLMSNGRLIINSTFADTELGKYILNKFFKQNYNIHLDESFGASLADIKDFKVTNHLAMGHVTDQLSVDAFEKGFNLISIRSFVDHIIYYFTYLKQAGKAGVPFEFEYGSNENFFALNVHAAVNEFVAEYLIDSFGPINSKDPLSYLLGVVSRSCDFLDITYVEDPSRIVLTAFFARENGKQISGLSFNNVQTTAQVLAQLDKKINNYVPEEESSNALAKKQEAMFDQSLPGGFFDAVTPLSSDSVLAKDEKEAQTTMNFVLDNFAQAFPDLPLAEFDGNKLDQFLENHPNQEFVSQLTPEDKEHLIQKVQKKPAIDAFEEEARQVREELKEDTNLQQKLESTLTEEVAERVKNHIDANILNNILATPAPPVFNGGDPFAHAPNMPFALPEQAAKKIAEQGFEKFENNPIQAQAFAVEMAKKASQTYDDPEQAKEFADKLVDQFQEQFPDLPKQQLEVFKNVVHAQAVAPQPGETNGEGAVAFAVPPIQSLPMFDGSDPFAAAPGEFAQPIQAAEIIAAKAIEEFKTPQEIQDFAANVIAQAPDKFETPEAAKEFSDALIQSIQPNLPQMQELQMQEFQTQMGNVATGNAAEFVLPPMPGTPIFDASSDPFAISPTAFAEPAKAAQDIAQKASVQFETPEQMQAFALNMAIKAQGQFSEPEKMEEFAQTLTDQFADQFEDDAQKGAFAETVMSLAAGLGNNMPEMAEDPFAPTPMEFASADQDQKISGADQQAEGSQTISGSDTEEEAILKIGGGPDDPEGETRVKGGKDEADDFMQKISGMKAEKEKPFVATFSDSFGENAQKGAFNFKSLSKPERKKKMKMFVKSTLDSSEDLQDMDLKVKAFMHKNAPEKLDAALDEFAFDLGVSADSLSNDQLMEFKTTKLPEVMTNLVEDEFSIKSFKSELEDVGNNIQKISATPVNDDAKFQMKFKQKLEDKLQNMQEVKKVDGRFVIEDGQVSEDQMQQVIKNTMKETVEEELKLSNASPEEIENKEEQLVKSLSSTLQMNEQDVQNIVKGATNKAKEEENQAVANKIAEKKQAVQNSGGSKSEAALISKLKQAENEKKQLESKVKALEVQAQAAKESESKIKEINQNSKVDDVQVKEALVQEEAKKDVATKEKEKSVLEPTFKEGESEALLESLKSGRALSPNEFEKLQRALAKEQESIGLIKKSEAQAKKAEIENQKLQANFTSELNRTTKALKAKDMVLDKAKESMKNVLVKKEKEMSELKKQVNSLNQQLASDKSIVLESQLKAVLAEKENMEKQTEVYKNKLDMMTKNLEKNKKEDNSAVLTEENRALKGIKNQLEHKLNAEIKTKRSIEERYQKAKAFETEARSELVSLKTNLKTSQGQLRVLQSQNEQLMKKAAQANNTGGTTDKEVGILKSQNNKLQEKIKILTSKLNQAAQVKSVEPDKVNTVELQKSKVELEKSTKEISLLKDQNTKLQEMIAKLKEEIQDVPIKEADPEKIAEVQAAKDEKAESAAMKEVSILKEQNEELQSKIQAMAAKLKKATEEPDPKDAEDNKSSAEKRLEQSVKTMNQELTKAKTAAAEHKKEVMQAKKEITGLKNKLSLMQKALEKSEAAAKKKDSSKKKAA